MTMAPEVSEDRAVTLQRTADAWATRTSLSEHEAQFAVGMVLEGWSFEETFEFWRAEFGTQMSRITTYEEYPRKIRDKLMEARDTVEALEKSQFDNRSDD
jgi:hypothetical protein